MNTITNTVTLCNAFSLQMLDLNTESNVKVTPIDIDKVKQYTLKSAIGHADTAAILTNMLGQDIAMNRTNVKLNKGDKIVVAQITGGRLPEGATTLPEGFDLTFVLVEVA